MEEFHKEYVNGRVTVIWIPERCIHSGICCQLLPDVYRPEMRPWITATNASEEELMAQIEMCPSRALQYRFEENKQD